MDVDNTIGSFLQSQVRNNKVIHKNNGNVSEVCMITPLNLKI